MKLDYPEKTNDLFDPALTHANSKSSLFVNILAWYFPEKIKIKDIFHQFFFDPPYFSKPQLFEC
jgi:hypothetical protein